MSLPDRCPTCLRADRSSPASIRQSLERDVETWQAEATHLAARVAELEAREVAALARLAAKDARIESSRLENEAVRRQLGHAENACDAMEKRVAELEARCKRLEEAGDNMLSVWLMPEDSMSYSDWVCLSSDAKSGWYAAKEAKP